MVSLVFTYGYQITLINCIILEPNRHAVIEDLRPDTQYTIRVRANDNLGQGKLSNAISVKTKEAGK